MKLVRWSVSPLAVTWSHFWTTSVSERVRSMLSSHAAIFTCASVFGILGPNATWVSMYLNAEAPSNSRRWASRGRR